MRAIVLEEHFLTRDALKATDHLRERGLAISYHDVRLKEKLLDIGAGRIADMDESGIDLQVLSLAVCGVEELDEAQAVAIAHDTNEQLAAAVRAHPKRFAGFATLALQAPEKAAAEFEHCIQKLGFRGALINGMTQGAFLDHPRFTPVLEVAQALNVPIYIHPAPPPMRVREIYYSGLPNYRGDILSIGGWGWHSEVAVASLRLIAAGIFDRYPNLKIIIGHMGENIPFALARIDSILSNPEVSWTFTRTLANKSTAPDMPDVRLQRRVVEYFRENFWITTSGFFTHLPLLLATQVLGADRVLFSVDYPFVSATLGRDFLTSLSATMSMSESDIARLAHRNAEKLLGV